MLDYIYIWIYLVSYEIYILFTFRLDISYKYVHIFCTHILFTHGKATFTTRVREKNYSAKRLYG